MATKKRDPMLGMSLRERTQYKAKQAQKKIAESKAAKANQLKIDKEAEAARAAAPKNERERAQSEGGGMGKPKPKPKPTPAAKPVKPSSVKPQVAKPESGPKRGDTPAKPTKPEAAKPKKTIPAGAPNPKDPKYNGTEGFKRYIRDRKAWERKQKGAKTSAALSMGGSMLGG
jgi:hypothetical protein